MSRINMASMLALTAAVVPLSVQAQQVMTGTAIFLPPAQFLAGEQEYDSSLNNGIIVNNPINTVLDSTGVVTAHDLNYSEYGTWTQQKGPYTILGTYQTGTPTPTTSIPSTGKATYTGGLVGQALMDGKQYKVSGSETINVQFAAKTIDAAFSLNKQSVSGGPKTFFGSLTSASSIQSNGYWQSRSGSFATIAGTLAGRQTYYGYVDGRFYGPAAQETGGTFQAQSFGVFAQAAFSAKATRSK